MKTAVMVLWCVWLLWSTFDDKSGGVQQVFETRQACDAAGTREVMTTLRLYQDDSPYYEKAYVSPVKSSMVIVPKKGEKGWWLGVNFSCWPLGLEPSSISGGAHYPKGRR